ncbi:MAG: ABC transporter permease, partial [Clostridiales bacterium]|nr:ABC transporter permease [Clostridiales bacterium]
FGGIFFLAVFFSVVFTLATVLIIYYKQISEGYEDAARFEIMQKVGMTRRDIRRSVNSQMLTVFLLPVVMAGLHLFFACFIVRRLLLMVALDNLPLFVGTACGCFGAFAVVYAVVYRITSNAYYRLVSTN